MCIRDSQNAYRSAQIVLGLSEERAVQQMQSGDLLVGRVDSVNNGHIALRLGNGLLWRKALARRGIGYSLHVIANHAIVLKRKAG